MFRPDWLAEKRAELSALTDLALPEITPSRRDFTQFVATQKREIALVPRLQRVDPATGRAWPTADLVGFAQLCDDAETAAIAVRTAAVFGTSIADLDAVAATVTAPLLRDDLCLDERHVYHARLHGADAVVLPAGELDPAALRTLAALAASMHMTSVIEVAADAALAAALALPTVCIGLAVTDAAGQADLVQVRRLAGQIPRHRIVLLLAEVGELDALGALTGLLDAAVVGDALLDAADPAAAIAAFVTGAG